MLNAFAVFMAFCYSISQNNNNKLHCVLQLIYT